MQGNHDHAMCQRVSPEYADWFSHWKTETFGEAAANDDLISAETRAFLRDLPLSLRFEWAERRVLLRHASTWDQTTYVRPNLLREPFYRIAREAQAQAADYVILGHTHMPMAVEVGGVWVFNPGSVDGNRVGAHGATCALLELSPLRYRVFDVETGKPTAYTFNRINPNQHADDGHTHIELS